MSINTCKQNVLSKAEYPLRNPAWIFGMISAISAYLESLLFRIAVNNLTMEDISAMHRYESGFFGSPFFLYIGRMIPKVQQSGITPLSSI
jgi:hypothetical protein